MLRLAHLVLRRALLVLRLAYLALRLAHLVLRRALLVLRLAYLALRLAHLVLRLAHLAPHRVLLASQALARRRAFLDSAKARALDSPPPRFSGQALVNQGPPPLLEA